MIFSIILRLKRTSRFSEDFSAKIDKPETAAARIDFSLHFKSKIAVSTCVISNVNGSKFSFELPCFPRFSLAEIRF